MKLNDVAVRKAKPETKSYKMSDGGGMYLEVMPNGSKYWRLKYRFGGKEKRLALGVYPDVPLTLARERREKARKLLAGEIDPGEVGNNPNERTGRTPKIVLRPLPANGLPNIGIPGLQVMRIKS